MGSRIGRLFGYSGDTRILLAGLDDAGKTTILYKMKLGEIVTTIPRTDLNVETIQYSNIILSVWDVAGKEQYRPFMRHYMRYYIANSKALIYVIDSNDHERLNDAKSEMISFLSQDELRDSPVLVLANKQDLPNAKSPTAISEALELHKVRQQCHIIPTVATTGDGLQEGLQWMTDMLQKRYLRKDSNQLLHLKAPGAKTEHKSCLSYLGKTWQLFFSLLLGSEESQMILTN